MPRSTHSFDVKPVNHDFSAMHKRMQWYIDQEITASCMSLVLDGLDIVDYKTFGYMDLDSRTPLRDDAIYRMYSNTKIVTSVAAMLLLERGPSNWTTHWRNTCQNLQICKCLMLMPVR